MNIKKQYSITKNYNEEEYIITITISDKKDIQTIECINNNIFYIYEANFAKEYFYQNPFEDLVSQFKNDKIVVKKTGNIDELKLDIKDNIYINETNFSIKDEIKKEIIENENITKIVKLKNNNIYIEIIKDKRSHKFKLGNNDLDENKFDDFYEDMNNGLIDMVKDNNRFKLQIKLNTSTTFKKFDINQITKLNELDDFLERKDFNEVEDIFYYKNDDIKEMRTDNILKEMKDKQKTIKKDCPALLKNIDVMKSNADLLIFPKKRMKVKGDKEINDKIDSQIILKKEHFNLINNKLREIFECDVRYHLLYRASIDRDLAKIFKEKCRDVCGTLVVVRTEKNNIFGGFTFIPWDDSERNYEDEKAFCFSVDNKRIYKIKKYLSAIGCDRGSGPRFNDMFMIPNKFMSNQGTLFWENQSHYSGQSNDFELTKGEETFFVYELEVFKIDEK